MEVILARQVEESPEGDSMGASGWNRMLPLRLAAIKTASGPPSPKHFSLLGRWKETLIQTAKSAVKILICYLQPCGRLNPT